MKYFSLGRVTLGRARIMFWMWGKIVDYLECKNKSPLMKKKSNYFYPGYPKNHRQKYWEGQGTQWSVWNIIMVHLSLIIYSVSDQTAAMFFK